MIHPNHFSRFFRLYAQQIRMGTRLQQPTGPATSTGEVIQGRHTKQSLRHGQGQLASAKTGLSGEQEGVG